MAEPLLVMVKTALPPLQEPETLILDLSHPVSVDVGVLVAVLTGVLVAVLTGVLVAVSTGVLVGTLVGGLQFPANLTEPLLVVEKPSAHVELTVNVTFPD
jgi:hypothetical protein